MQRLFLFGLLPAILAIGIFLDWLWSDSDTSESLATPPRVVLEQRIDYRLSGLQISSMGEDGLAQRILRAQQIEHYDDGTASLEAPSLDLKQHGETAWEIIADSGQISADGAWLILLGEVRIERKPRPGVKPLSIRTRDLRIQTQQDYAETTEKVSVTSNQDRLESIGMQAWLKHPSRIQLLADVRGFYAPPQ